MAGSDGSGTPVSERLAIIVPVFNDWTSFAILCRNIDRLAPAWGVRVSIIAVDDCSAEPLPADAQLKDLTNVCGLEILSLVCNLGHQRAIAVGLAAALDARDFNAVVIADADGEDRPEDIGRMIDAHRRDRGALIVGRRAARSEGLGFRAFYCLYKLIFRLSTGKNIDFGNFSLLPIGRLQSVLYMPESWNHLAATMLRSRIPLVRLDCVRGTRYAGTSSMNLVSLSAHGISAVSVFNDLVFTRLLALSAVVAALSFCAALAATIVRLTTQAAIPGWATTVVGISGVMFFQALILSVVAAISLLGGRSSVAFIPARQATQFIATRTVMVPP
jgi:glycosyltransferase involved in cell wall biosynthesis